MADSHEPVKTEADRRNRRAWGCLLGIGVLGGLVVLPQIWKATALLVRGPTERRLKSAARLDITSIQNAAEEYLNHYGRLPWPPNAPPNKDGDFDTSGPAGIVAMLKGQDLSQNPQCLDFLGEMRDAKRLSDPDRYVSGLWRASESLSAIHVPWGRPFLIRLDGDGDGKVENPGAPGMPLLRRVIIWSAGKDGNPATWDDNVWSWQ